MIIYQTSLIGKRSSNEDQHQIVLNMDNSNPKLKDINFFSIYDGHGGNKVAKFLKNNLSQYFLRKNIQYPLSENYINKVFNHLQKKLAIDHKDFAYASGSTCLVLINFVINKKSYIYIFNSGDCRAVICNDNLPIPLTKDHKPEWPDEKNRITKLGGEIYFDGSDYRIKDLSVSRAFGDIDASPYVTHLPDIFKHKITYNDKFIVMACDGLWDVLQNSQVINFILSKVKLIKNKKKNEGNYEVHCNDGRINLAKCLAEYAISEGSTDNITVIIIFL